MRTNGRLFATLGVAAGMLAFAAGAAADELGLSADLVSAGELATQRGGDIQVAADPETLAAAIGIQQQTITNTFTATTVNGGSVTAGNGTFQNQVMSLNVINTGNNVAVQTQNVIAVNIIESMVTLP